MNCNNILRKQIYYLGCIKLILQIDLYVFVYLFIALPLFDIEPYLLSFTLRENAKYDPRAKDFGF